MSNVNFIENFAATVNELAAKYIEQSIVLGNILTSQGQLANALAQYQEAQRVLEMLGSGRDAKAAQVLFHIANVLQRDGKHVQAASQYELAVNTLGESTIGAVSTWLTAYLDERRAAWLIQMKPLYTEEVASATGMLPMLMHLADELGKNEGKPPLPYFLAPSDDALTGMEVRLNAGNGSHDGFAELREVLTRVVNGFDVSERGGVEGIHVDDDYVRWYDACHQGDVKAAT